MLEACHPNDLRHEIIGDIWRHRSFYWMFRYLGVHHPIERSCELDNTGWKDHTTWMNDDDYEANRKIML